MTADYLAMERSYLQRQSGPAVPMLVSFEGRIEVRKGMEGPPREHMVVDRFGSAQPGRTCESMAADKGKTTATLRDSSWKLKELGGAKVVVASTQHEVRITLASEGARLTGFSGCNQLIGSYESKDQALRSHPAGTMMACEPALMDPERKVVSALEATTAYRIEGQRLILLNGEKELASFEATALR